MLAYMLCRQAIVPLHLSKSDLDRTETMLGMMARMREQGEIQTQVAAIVWNCVKVYRDEQWEHSGLSLPFRPAKVSLDILDACNTRLFDTVQELRGTGLFVHGDVDKDAFVRQSVLVVREIADNVLKPSEELGVSFASMREQLAGKTKLPFVTEGVKYEASGNTIEAASFNIEDLDECYNSREPDKLLMEMALETPEHSGVPWITVDGSVQKESYESGALKEALRKALDERRKASFLAIGSKTSEAPLPGVNVTC